MPKTAALRTRKNNVIIKFLMIFEFSSGYFASVFRTVLWGEENIGRMAGKGIKNVKGRKDETVKNNLVGGGSCNLIGREFFWRDLQWW